MCCKNCLQLVVGAVSCWIVDRGADLFLSLPTYSTVVLIASSSHIETRSATVSIVCAKLIHIDLNLEFLAAISFLLSSSHLLLEVSDILLLIVKQHGERRSDTTTSSLLTAERDS